MSGIAVLLNPKSRRNLRDRGALRPAHRLARLVGDQGFVRELGDEDTLERVLEELHREPPEILALSGGDGTTHVVLSALARRYGDDAIPPLALLRGGTMNTVAHSLGLPRAAPEALLARLVDARRQGRLGAMPRRSRHLLRVGEHRGFLFGTGVVRGFLAEYYRDDEKSPLTAARTLARCAASALVGGRTLARIAAPFRGRVTLDDGTVWGPQDYLAVAGGTIDTIGLGFRPFHRFAETPGTVHLLGIRCSPLTFVGELPRVYQGQPMRRGRAVEATPRRAIVEAEGDVVRFMVDGDLHETTGPLTLDVGRRVDFVVPNVPGARGDG